MSVLHQARTAARRLGVDVARYPEAALLYPTTRLLEHFAVDVVLDIGANAGQYAAELRRLGYRGRIVSFEPLSEPRRELDRRAARDARWAVLPYALGDRDGTATVNVARNGGASSSLLPMLPRHEQAAPQATCIGTEEVRLRRLDGVWGRCAEAGDRVFLKLDVQGYEAHVLHGAGRFAQRCVGLQTEVSLVPLYEGGLLFHDALTLAERGLGLTLMSVLPGFADPRSGQMLQCDLTFFRDDGNGAAEALRQAGARRP